MAKETTPTRPLTPTGIMTEFGELQDGLEDNPAMGGQQIDYTYTPGWSEMRYQRDAALAEVVQGKRSKNEVPTLPVNVRLVRRSNVQGAPDLTKQVTTSNKGYTAITEKDIGQPWFTSMPPGAIKLADGTIAKGDCVYMVCSKEQAARNVYQKDRTTMQRLTGAAERAERAGVRYESTPMEPLKGAPPSKINVS